MYDNFKLGTGFEINSEGVIEAYSINKSDNGYYFTANVSIENIEKVFKHLSQLLEEPLFLVLEIPTNQKDEEKLRVSDTMPFHNDVFYLDGISFETFLNIYTEYKTLLKNDGYVRFGVGSRNGDEVFVGKYKIFKIFAKEIQPYIDTLNKLGFNEVKELKTVCDNISPLTPALRKKIVVNDIDIYKMVENLKSKGLYFAKHCED